MTSFCRKKVFSFFRSFFESHGIIFELDVLIVIHQLFEMSSSSSDDEMDLDDISDGFQGFGDEPAVLSDTRAVPGNDPHAKHCATLSTRFILQLSSIFTNFFFSPSCRYQRDRL